MRRRGPILHRLDLPRKAQAGQAILEFMLILPLLFVIVAAVWEYGRVFDAQLVAQNAAREGARFASVNTMTYTGCNACLATETTKRVKDYLQSGYGPRLKSFVGTLLNPNGDVAITAVTVCYMNDGAGTTTCGASGVPQPGDRVQVAVQGTVRVFMPFLPGLTDPHTMIASAAMLEQ